MKVKDCQTNSGGSQDLLEPLFSALTGRRQAYGIFYTRNTVNEPQSQRIAAKMVEEPP